MPRSEVHTQHRDGTPLGHDEAVAMAELVQGLAAPNRLVLLEVLRDGELAVNEVAQRAGLTPSAVSQQLRVLRHLRLVVARRDGRSVRYRLHSSHVAGLLDEIRAHAEHVRMDWASPAKPTRRQGVEVR